MHHFRALVLLLQIVLEVFDWNDFSVSCELNIMERQVERRTFPTCATKLCTNSIQANIIYSKYFISFCTRKSIIKSS